MGTSESVNRKIKKKRTGFIFMLLILSVTIFVILLTKTNVFHLSRVEVSNNKMIDKEKVFIASGLQLGQDIFRINVKKVEKNLLSHPYIKNVKVRRRLPNKMYITVEERIEAMVISSMGSYIYLDDEGIIVNVLTENKENNLLEIKNVELETMIVGQQVVLGNNIDINDIIKFIRLCEEENLLESIKCIEFDTDTKIFFELKSGTKVAFGGQNKVQYKLRYLLKIIEKRKEQNLTLKGTIDFERGEYPTFNEQNF